METSCGPCQRADALHQHRRRCVGTGAVEGLAPGLTPGPTIPPRRAKPAHAALASKARKRRPATKSRHHSTTGSLRSSSGRTSVTPSGRGYQAKAYTMLGAFMRKFCFPAAPLASTSSPSARRMSSSGVLKRYPMGYPLGYLLGYPWNSLWDIRKFTRQELLLTDLSQLRLLA